MKRIFALLVCCTMLSASVQGADNSNAAPSDWAAGDVNEARSKGIVPDFLMNNYGYTITRGEFCTLCANTLRAWGIDKKTEANASFSDVKEDFKDDILYCASLGIVSGTGNGKFEPYRSITRQEAAKMLYNTLNLTDTLTSLEEVNGVNGVFLPHVFGDGADLSSWARNEIYVMYHTGVMLGDKGNNFNPYGSYTREQAIATFNRLYNAKGKTNVDFAKNAELYPDSTFAPACLKDNGENVLAYLLTPYKAESKADYKYYDGFGNSYKAADKGYTYPIGTKYSYCRFDVHNSALIDKSGNMNTLGGEEILGICCQDTDRGTALVRVNRPENVCDHTGYKLMDINTGEEIKPVEGMKYIYPVGEGMYYADCGDLGLYLDKDFKPVTRKAYKMTDCRFSEGKCIVKKQDDTFVLIDSTGKELKALDKAPYMSSGEVYVYGSEEKLVVANALTQADLYRVKSADFIFDDKILAISENDNPLVINSRGKVVFDGRELGYTGIKPIDGCKDAFAARTLNGSYDVFYNYAPVYRGIYNYDFIRYEGGIFCGGKNNKELVTFDTGGNKIGTIALGDADNFSFVNGLIYLSSVNNDTCGAYYTPDGRRALTNAIAAQGENTQGLEE